ncbi:MAG TPA: hypothetical protein DCY48_02370 [Candidatus Magasanikbacteria bacterium]|nr:MAG: hypothetical protein A3I74_01285 [Candidatus Magasanikbacteria bacterium RIFCSPLOWO2_02_FULL_47_16]OGH79926.1 MAG: hypothetical protein A3C10_01940 [Candidatus Magasanikbacteria bacterium RIFCSPHIGHO2_02_FULL_48_18]OGH81784.1 MAG: hypothetical protein A3G08_01570 [Candidatus Magasanikbacteria bacterium RIFCSPLOWO2_12_FULL_47_9b]HAZ28598.1 hypothetical protein [Candidatus Magasanikbacteria bacterium]
MEHAQKGNEKKGKITIFFVNTPSSYRTTRSKTSGARFWDRNRHGVVMLVIYGMALLIAVRLFDLMVVRHEVYVALAEGTQSVAAKLFPNRGNIFFQDSRTGGPYAVAMNKDYFVVFADTRAILTDDTAENVAEQLSSIFLYDDEKKFSLFLALNKRTDPYEPVEQKVDEATKEAVEALSLPGIGFIRKSYRFYPEGSLGSHVIGFVGKDAEGNEAGRYGVEGYWDKELAGSGGFLEAAKSATGSLILRNAFQPAEDGAHLFLTIDRTLQHRACDRLRRAMEETRSASASLIIAHPHTGALLAVCSLPDFDPNEYNKADSVDVYNNSAIFTPYEPGSIFKPIAMAAALDQDFMTPDTTFVDSGSRAELCTKPIMNAGQRSYGLQTMTEVLENSVNTGMVFVVEKIGKKVFREYVERFGFGVKEGIDLDKENTGVIRTLWENKGDRVDCYTATASFGQGITATPLQMVSAFGAIANGGKLMKPYVVDRIEYPNGKMKKTQPLEVRQVLQSRSAALLTGMLVSVVQNGYDALGISAYHLAGKTGTAQIPGPGGYIDETIHSFIGFGPVEDPKFVMIIKLEKPQTYKYASNSLAPVFADIAKFILAYYEVPPSEGN